MDLQLHMQSVPIVDTTLCHKSLTGWWFSLGTTISSTNKTDRHDIAEILLKVALNAINHKAQPIHLIVFL
jgi:hypothetical protein